MIFSQYHSITQVALSATNWLTRSCAYLVTLMNKPLRTKPEQSASYPPITFGSKMACSKGFLSPRLEAERGSSA